MRSNHVFHPSLLTSLLTAAGLLLAPGATDIAWAVEDGETRTRLLADDREESDPADDGDASDALQDEWNSEEWEDEEWEDEDQQPTQDGRDDAPDAPKLDDAVDAPKLDDAPGAPELDDAVDAPKLDDVFDEPKLEGGPDAPKLEGGPDAPRLDGGPTRPRRTGEPIEDLYVTATKREESIQDVAISMKALNADFLADSGLTEFGQLQEYVPNLSINPVTDTRGTVIRIRGIGSVGNNSGIDPSVGVFIDGVYQGRAGMSVGDMLDVERVEVLRGPQGTLYGKNTAAGLISIVSKRPHYELESTLEGVFGNYGNFEGRGSVNIPILDGRIATRLSGYRVVRDGFDENIFDGGDVNNGDKWGIKSRWVFDIAENLSLLLTGDYSFEDTTCCVPDIVTYEGAPTLWKGFPPLSPPHSFQSQAAATGIPLPKGDPYDHKVAVDADPKNEVEIGGTSLDLNYEIPGFPGVGDIPFLSGGSLQAIGSWRTYSSDSQFDGDFSWYDVNLAWTETDLDQYSAEVRFASPAEEIWTYQLGFYYYHQTQDTVDRLGLEQGALLTFGLLPQPTRNIGDNTHKTTSLAGFAQTTLNITDMFSVTGGVRYTREEKTRRGRQTSNCTLCVDAPPILGPDIATGLQERKVSNWSGMASLRFFPTDSAMFYFSWASGFKSGGFNQLRTTVNVPGEFDDEKSTNFELGAKTTWFDRMITLNGTFFYTIYEDFQAQTFDGSSINVLNAANLRSYGIEAELVVVPLPDLVLGMSFGWNVARYTDFENGEQTAQQRFDALADNPFPLLACDPSLINCFQDLTDKELENAPEVSLNMFGSYEYLLPWVPVALHVRAEYAFTSSRFLAQDLDPELKQDETHLVNLRGGIKAEDELWDLTFWVKNLTGEDWGVVGFDVPTLNGFSMVTGPPRQYGLTIRFNF